MPRNRRPGLTVVEIERQCNRDNENAEGGVDALNNGEEQGWLDNEEVEKQGQSINQCISKQ